MPITEGAGPVMSRPTVTVLSGGLGGARVAAALVAEGIDDRSSFVTNRFRRSSLEGAVVMYETKRQFAPAAAPRDPQL